MPKCISTSIKGKTLDKKWLKMIKTSYFADVSVHEDLIKSFLSNFDE